MQISPCTRLPSSYISARLSVPRQTVVGRQSNNMFTQQKAGLGLTRNPAQSTSSLNERIFKCKATTEDMEDVIDVEGKEIDDRIPVTVRLAFSVSGNLHIVVFN